MSRRGGRGKKTHKGQRRHFTSEEEMQAELEKNEREKEWRARKGLGSDEEDDEEKEKTEAVDEESDSEEEEEEDKDSKPKGVSSLIEVSNPNRLPGKVKKANADIGQAKVELSRREREELEKQQHHIRMLKLQDEGKTDQAKADLARLAIIRKQREEAAKKRELEKKAKESAQKKK